MSMEQPPHGSQTSDVGRLEQEPEEADGEMGDLAAAAASVVAPSAIGGEARVEMRFEPGTVSSGTAER